MFRLTENQLPADQMHLIQELIDAIPDPLFIKDLEGCYLACNQAFAGLTRLPIEAIPGKNASDVFPVELAESFIAKDRELFRGEGPVTSETWVDAPNGSRMCFEVLRTRFHGHPGKTAGLIGICRDITARKLAESALVENEHRFHDIMEFAPVGTSVAALDGQFIDVNQALCQLLGYDKAELQNLSINAITHPDDLARDGELRQQMLSGEISGAQLEKRLLHKQGHIVPVRLSVVLHKRAGNIPEFFIGQVQDLSEQVAARQRDHLMAQVLNNVFDAVITIDSAGIVDSFNLAAEKIFGYTAQEVIGQNIRMLMPEPFRSAHDGYLRRYLETGKTQIIGVGRELVGMRMNGELFPMDLAISEIEASDVRRFIGVIRDITDRKQSEAKIKYLAHHDALTGLPNRFLYEDRLSHAMAMARRDKQQIALMFIDLDNFKPVNDLYGHQIGDKLLQEVAQRLRSCLRDSDTAARIGGDEFVVLLPNVENLNNAIYVAEKILTQLRLPFVLEQHQAHISASIGVALSHSQNDTEKLITRRADAAMYRAKSRGRNNVTIAQAHDEFD